MIDNSKKQKPKQHQNATTSVGFSNFKKLYDLLQ